MTTPDMSNATQMPMPDVRGWLCINGLPQEYQRAEDSTADADRARITRPVGRNRRGRVGTFEREATPTERELLIWLGYNLDRPGDPGQVPYHHRP